MTAQLQQHTVNISTRLIKIGCEVLYRPIDIIRCFHNAFRRGISQIDDIVNRIARDSGNFTSILNRLHTMNEILDIHARGEEAAVFPAWPGRCGFRADCRRG